MKRMEAATEESDWDKKTGSGWNIKGRIRTLAVIAQPLA